MLPTWKNNKIDNFTQFIQLIPWFFQTIYIKSFTESYVWCFQFFKRKEKKAKCLENRIFRTSYEPTTTKK